MGNQKMIKHIKYHYKRKSKDILIEMDVDLTRFNRQFGEAQYKLDSMVMTHMIPFMPIRAGTFINVTRGLSAAIAGSGRVFAAAPPMGRFLYEGKVMVDETTGSPYARKGAKKVTVSQYSGKTNARENINYARSTAQAHWFDAAKRKYAKTWLGQIKRTAGGG